MVLQARGAPYQRSGPSYWTSLAGLISIEKNKTGVSGKLSSWITAPLLYQICTSVYSGFFFFFSLGFGPNVTQQKALGRMSSLSCPDTPEQNLLLSFNLYFLVFLIQCCRSALSGSAMPIKSKVH